jgi:hypothetical protein
LVWLAVGRAHAAPPVGLTFVMVGVLSQIRCEVHNDDCSSDARNTIVGTGVVLAITGALLCPLGWVTFGRNRRFELERESMARGATNPFTVGLRSTPGGALLAARWSF